MDIERTGFDEYYEAAEPGRRERAFGWATAIGLQQVDGLTPSDYLIKTAKRNIEGEISSSEARQLVDEYYETRLGHEEPTGHQEADKVSARMNQLIHAPVFGMTPEFFIGLHGKIFEGVFIHAGQIRDVELQKREWVLNGDSVQYEASFLIERALERHFEREQAFKYKGLSDDAFVHHFAAFVSRLWQIHPFREGNTRTTALMAIKYLRFMRYDVSNDLFARESYYFRNALVRANYDNRRLDIEKTLTPLEEFFRVLVFGEEIELHSRYLKIGQEYGTSAANAIANLHRRSVSDGKGDVGINVGIKAGSTEEMAIKAILRNPRITAAFTCTGPYAILIMLGIKRVENRSALPVPPKGRCAVSCSKSFCAAEYGAFVYWASMNLPSEDFERIPSWGEVKDWPGKVVGCCDYAAHGRNDLVLEAGDSVRERTRQVASFPWDEGYEYWWDLSGVVRFECPIPCRGNVGMWQMPSDLAAQVNAADALAEGVGEPCGSEFSALRDPSGV